MLEPSDDTLRVMRSERVAQYYGTHITKSKRDKVLGSGEAASIQQQRYIESKTGYQFMWAPTSALISEQYSRGFTVLPGECSPSDKATQCDIDAKSGREEVLATAATRPTIHGAWLGTCRDASRALTDRWASLCAIRPQ